MTMTTLSLHSYAKINLGLRVLRKRPDGYHEIETLMQTVDLTDTITVTAQQSGTTVTCTDPKVPTDERNLVAQAVRLMRDRYGIDAGVRIDIQKRIPVAAGLAGGSGNGAMTLLALNHLWRLALADDELFDLAILLGSDVPFCLTGGTTIARGRGECLEYLDTICPGMFILVNPSCAISSAWAYQHVKIDLTNTHSCINFVVCALRQNDITRLVSRVHNDLEESVLGVFPVVDRVKRTLIDCGAAGALMSGSGPTVFGIVPNRVTAEQVADRVRQADPQWRVYVVSPVSRNEIAAQRSF